MRKYPIIKNTAYHIYNRGFYKTRLFRCERDYRFFMYKIAEYKVAFNIKIYIYCLMPNHFHLLLRSGQSVLRISKFMQGVQQSYSRFNNRQYDNSGHTFQGPYENKPVIDRASFKHVYKYIQNNPVEAGLVKKPADWPYMAVYDTL